MENQLKNNERVTLELYGIDKKWVWSASKKWIDKDLEENLQRSEIIEDKSLPKRKWWQFRRK